MILFESDYTEGAHPEIMKRLAETNLEQLPGYGNDKYCASAKEKIRSACRCPQAEIFFLVGGTQTNLIVIDSMLKSYEGVVAADTGHVSTHEAGAIEYTGHKVLPIPHVNGKLEPEAVRRFLEIFCADGNREHMVFPGMVYISHPTEFGTLYTKHELQALSQVCREYQIPLFLDGARLGYGLACEGTDVTLPDVAELCDIFCIGGTKVGALCGEAVIFTKNNMPKHFLTIVKQHGALLAKGRLLGVQFDTLFTDDLYLRIGRHAIEMAQLLKRGIAEKGYEFLLDSPTNQQIVILGNETMRELAKEVSFNFWENVDENHTAVRFATSWATKEEDVRRFLEILPTSV
ncbi:MAG: low specificity L-threonine aldolase [Clostridiales bacterium]|nr:low specificity L-threonine aldolase [Clostridiales bacterium]